ncbi:MAG TPA: hypothetical protein VFU00_10190 [Gemmatimonadales bacterium]|nr:hypothetical protein [Gemmatimonadales bacterium]
MHSGLTLRCVALGALPLLLACTGFPDTARLQAQADSIRADSARTDSIARADSIRADSIRADSIRADSIRADSVRSDSIARARRRGSGSAAVRRAGATDSVPWPELPEAAPGALLPSHRIVAYYGNPLSKRMGILGQLPPAEMLRRLEETAQEWVEADSTRTVLPALHMIVTVAQGNPGPDGKYRLRMTDSLMNRVAGWAEERGWLFFVDVQVGLSDVRAELPRLVPLLRRPYVHLALDPEFAMHDGVRPGRRIGTMDAADINYAIDLLAGIVRSEGIPPKVLVVHRFTEKMLTNADRIRRDPLVQVVIDMDGFGSPSLKRSTWRAVIQRDPVQYTGFKLFYRNDKPMMTPRQVIELFPSPVYIQYQ